MLLLPPLRIFSASTTILITNECKYKYVFRRPQDLEVMNFNFLFKFHPSLANKNLKKKGSMFSERSREFWEITATILCLCHGENFFNAWDINVLILLPFLPHKFRWLISLPFNPMILQLYARELYKVVFY